MSSSAVRKDPYTCAKSTLCKGEAGNTGDWRSSRPVIDHKKCLASKSEKATCFLCWMYCPEGVVSRSAPVEIDMNYCKGCGICAEECPGKAITMVDEHQDDPA